MSLLTTIGYIRRDLNTLRYWSKHQFAMKAMPSSRFVFGRTHKWFMYEVILNYPPVIKKGSWDYRVHRLGNLIYPAWDCALLSHYSPGGRMLRHCDHSVFEPQVVLVNIGQATFCIDDQEYDLHDGQVISFDSSIPHELLPVVSERWSLTYRKIQPQYLRL
ncbi:cupin domain-containing protein [Aulosira sp. FACHB-615]|uniref:cupin domain-containing protein n=1 Tax=Aulosira sp. FACHB-615 TaxID=2692777 RepID=UPI00168A1367|nr:cupin domain-containing protein [Aulosira sp. FACHB-615]MBD2491178.1 cupin domain-containing protein [Aulosira sp. FACHB-615]